MNLISCRSVKAVSIHAPAWGATWSGSSGLRAGRGFQSTRPRGARRLIPGPASAAGRVSIHAPAWGATRQACRKERLARVSIHAPAWGATRSPCWPSPASGSFNPRARVGRDLTGGTAFSDGPMVSIHAPAWGATSTSSELWLVITSFNPRARVGRDISDQYAHIDRARFQSTRPRGARRDRKFLGLAVKGVSIHAPAWGATIRHGAERVGMDSFNPRARVGRDPAASPLAAWRCAFQSTRPRGARL